MSKSDTFPRATPFRTPETNGKPLTPAAPRQLNQYLVMGGFCVLFLGVGLGVGMLFMRGPDKKEGSSPKPDNAAPEKKDNAGPEKKDNGASQKLVGNLDDSLGTLKDSPLAQPGKENARPEGGNQAGLPMQGGRMTSQPGTPTNIPEAVVEALGGLTASHLYQTYLNIGLLADSVEGEVYEKDEARRVLETVAGLMTAVEQQLDSASRQSLKGDEKKAIEQARQVTASLRTQVRELQNYWDKGDKENVTRFHQARKDAWDGIKSLLNIQE